MGLEVLAWIDAQTSMREVVARIRAEPVAFVVLHHGGSLYAFRPDELAAYANRDAPAHQVLGLGAWNASRRGGLDPSPPRVTRSSGLSSFRTVYLDAAGRPTRVVDASPEAISSGTSRSAEGTTLTRYPSINATLPVDPAAEVTLVIDLEQSPLEAVSADPIRFEGLPKAWTEFPVIVRVTSPQLRFDEGDGEGTIRVRRDQASVKCRLAGHRIAGATEPIEVTAMFFRGSRWCGTAQRTFAPGGWRASAGTGGVAMPPGGQAPDLTVHIHRTESDRKRLVWSLMPAVAHRAHVSRASAETSLGEDPGQYVRGLFEAAAGIRPGMHVALLRGIGERLWELAPPAFHDAYWAMRTALGDGFTIQFITDEPYIPWELMRPVKAGEPTRLLAETHPVARGLLKYPDRLRPVLPLYGDILTVAPDYAKRVASPLPPIVAAGEESAMLQQRFRAIAIAPASAGKIIATFADARKQPVRLLHFAGHGRFETPADSSHLACEDGNVGIHQVRRQETRLGEKYQTFVILNACELGATGDVLDEVGGWAEAFAYCNFSGFIAPLWAVFDDHAKLAMESFFEAIFLHGKPVGEALRDVRATYGKYSPTFLSYVYYGDVNARFG